LAGVGVSGGLAANGWNHPGNPANTLLEATAYTTSMTYDALNRIKGMRYPQTVDGTRKELIPRYNRSGALEQVNFDGKLYVERIAYNAKGQRVLIAYGNGVMTRHAYDLQTFRLVRLRSQPYDHPNLLTYQPKGAPLQEFAYEYDLVGNIAAIHDRTPGSGVVGNLPLGANGLDRSFTYDPLYRLLTATGRECKDIPQPRPWEDEPRCGFNSGNHGTPNQDNAPNLTALYREGYAYDAGGNVLNLQHQQLSPGGIWETSWSRNFGMGGLTPDQWQQEWVTHLNQAWLNPPSNRLTHLESRRSGVANPPVVTQTHFFDDNGNLIRENNARHFEWDYADRMRVFRTQTGNAEPTVHAHYLYDASGQRVKKLVRKQGGQVEVTVYIDGVFEYQRIVQGGVTRENNTLHVMDNQSRIALVRVGNPFPDDTTPAVKYHLGDHLGSSNVVVDEAGNWVNREEYTPYGETSFGSFARKRYRFSGKERDEESGLFYFGFRYYAPHLARWMSCDPAGAVDGSNLYCYVSDNPIRLKDAVGLEDTDEAPTPMENAAGASSVANHASGPPPPPKTAPRYSIDSYSKFKDIPQSKRTGGTNLEAHHPIQSEWAKQNVVDYSHGKAPSQLLETGTGEEHTQISNDQRTHRPESGDWSEKSFSEARSEACVQYEDAGLMTNAKQGLPALLESDAYFFSLGDKVTTDRATGQPTVQKNARFNEQMNKAVEMGPGQSAKPTSVFESTGFKESASATGEALQGAGKVLTYYALVKSAQNVTDAIDRDIQQGTGGKQTARVVAHEAAGWAAAGWAAGEGAALGLLCGPAAEICSPVGALFFGIAGYYGGAGSADSILFFATGH
jgi:RHS repeat-associated protein